jgi:hypothetical protein
VSDLSVDSLVIGSERPDDLKEWYRTTFAVPEDDDGAFVFGDLRIFVFPHSEIHGTAKEPARIMLNIRTPDARALERDLKAKDVTFVRDVTEEPFGLLGTIADPDGNYLQLFQPATAGTTA